MAVTISDVAREAGVSTSTVSKVLNKWSTISPETTKRVHDAIKQLHYVPNARAVSFARGAARNILFLSSFEKEEAYHNPHMFDILCGVRRELADRGYTLMVSSIPAETDSALYIEDLISKKIADGIIVHGSAYQPEIAKTLVFSQFPHMLIGHPGPGSRLCWIDTNNGLAGEYAAQHMLQCGYTKLAFIGGQRTDYISAQRLNGFLGVMYEYGCREPEEYICYTDSSMEESCQAALSLLALPAPPRAIICENNVITLGVMNALREKGKRIPEETAFLTFDSYPYSAIISPPPTIIDIDVYDLGIQAAVMLLRKIENPSLLVQT